MHTRFLIVSSSQLQPSCLLLKAEPDSPQGKLLHSQCFTYQAPFKDKILACCTEQATAKPEFTPTLVPTSLCSKPSNDDTPWCLTGSYHQLGEGHGPTSSTNLTPFQLSQHACLCCPLGPTYRSSKTPQMPLFTIHYFS